jgi:hypothetical protein
VLVQRHFQDSIAPQLVGAQNEATQCQDQIEQLTNILEIKVTLGLSACIDLITG